MDPENENIEKFRIFHNQIKIVGFGYIPLKKPQLTAILEKRNRHIKAIESIILSEFHKSDDLGGIDHIIYPQTNGFLIEHSEDFSLSKADEVYLKNYIRETDELLVIFGMHIIAIVSPKAVQILESPLYVKS